MIFPNFHFCANNRKSETVKRIFGKLALQCSKRKILVKLARVLFTHRITFILGITKAVFFPFIQRMYIYVNIRMSMCTVFLVAELRARVLYYVEIITLKASLPSNSYLKLWLKIRFSALTKEDNSKYVSIFQPSLLRFGTNSVD